MPKPEKIRMTYDETGPGGIPCDWCGFPLGAGDMAYAISDEDAACCSITCCDKIAAREATRCE
jgi:hypothetical protein